MEKTKKLKVKCEVCGKWIQYQLAGGLGPKKLVPLHGKGFPDYICKGSGRSIKILVDETKKGEG